eukprot:gb/GECG01001874.1/.p1 GENE.gb/GECG01001874.1/~~gb/GECG01001874.1/.p1  ORF type:complete len:102 (+),score=11.04 gb/GECG01001874.1/:1-306(+)
MENYTMKKVIGKGAFGKAVLAVDNRSSEKVVIKVVDVRDMPEAERRAAQKEVTILSKLSHPGKYTARYWEVSTQRTMISFQPSSDILRVSRTMALSILLLN